ncbi:MAG: Plug domain-containing protein [Gammaproteobacteria bacterium]
MTARRREENLQAVPAALSAISGDHLDSSYTVNTNALSQLVPSLYYNSANPRNTAYTIRGLGSNTLSISAANDGIEPGVGFYVDQVYHGRPATASFDFTDIERRRSAARTAGNAIRQEHDRRRHSHHQP